LLKDFLFLVDYMLFEDFFLLVFFEEMAGEGDFALEALFGAEKREISIMKLYDLLLGFNSKLLLSWIRDLKNRKVFPARCLAEPGYVELDTSLEMVYLQKHRKLNLILLDPEKLRLLRFYRILYKLSHI